LDASRAWKKTPVLCGTTHVGRVGFIPGAELDYFVIVDERSDFLVREQGNFRQS